MTPPVGGAWGRLASALVLLSGVLSGLLWPAGSIPAAAVPGLTGHAGDAPARRPVVARRRPPLADRPRPPGGERRRPRAHRLRRERAAGVLRGHGHGRWPRDGAARPADRARRRWQHRG